MTTKSDASTSDEEIAKRRDAALLRALSTPHKKQAVMKKGKRGTTETAPRPSEEVVKDGGDSPEARR